MGHCPDLLQIFESWTFAVNVHASSEDLQVCIENDSDLIVDLFKKPLPCISKVCQLAVGK
jgi:hypothetical protein